MLAQDYVDRARYLPALEGLHRAISLFSALQDTVWLIKAKSMVATVYHEMRDYEQGVAAGKQTLALAKNYAMRSQQQQAWVDYMDVLTFTAINYDDGGKPDSAIACYQQAQAIAHLLPDTTYLAQTYSNMGNSLLKLGRLEKAEHYIRRALAMYELRGTTYGIVGANTNLGRLALPQQDPAGAQQHLFLALSLANRLNNVEKLRDVYLHLSEYYQTLANTDSAVFWLKRHHALKTRCSPYRP